MSIDLTPQIRETFETLDEMQGAVTLEDVLHAAGPVRPMTIQEPVARPRNWRTPVIAAAAAAAIVLVALLPWLLSTGDDTPPVTVSSTTSTTLTATTSTVPPEVTPTTLALPGPVVPPGASPAVADLPTSASLGWEWIEVDAETGFDRFEDGTFYRYDQGWSGTFPTADVDEVILLSEDGTTWEEIDLPQFDGLITFGGAGARQGSPLIVWVTDPAFPEDTSAQVWHTADGREWTHVNPPAGLTEPFRIGTRTWNSDSDDHVVLHPSPGVPEGMWAVSDDGGASFELVPILGMTDLDDGLVQLYTVDNEFFALAWTPDTDRGPEDGPLWPTLYRSDDGKAWNAVGNAEGLLPHENAIETRNSVLGDNPEQWNGHLFCAFGPCRIDVLPDGTKIFTGLVTDADGTTYMAYSVDGLHWEEATRLPVDEEGNRAVSGQPDVVGSWVIFNGHYMTQNLYEWIRIAGPGGDVTWTCSETASPGAPAREWECPYQTYSNGWSTIATFFERYYHMVLD